VHRRLIVLAVVSLTWLTTSAPAQQPRPASSSLPVANHSQADCSGFISENTIPRNLVVVGGDDDSFRSAVRQWVEGDSVFIGQRKGADIAVGSEYSVVRPADDLFLAMHYPEERAGIRKSGKPYENIGRVKVIPLEAGMMVGEVASASGNVKLHHVEPASAVAKVTFSCGSIVPGDLLIPYQPSPIPEYTVSKPLDPFVPLDSNKQHGRITATHNNSGFVGDETIVYLNLGEKDGAKPGERFRIYKRPPPQPGYAIFITQTEPTETIGEAVVISVQPKSCTAMVVSSYRAVAAGDYVEAE